MTSSGDEKRIQALFHELRLQDGQAAPQFAEVSGRNQVRFTRLRTSLDLRFAMAVLLACFALLSLALMSKHWQRSGQSRTALASGVATPPATQMGIAREQPSPLMAAKPEHRARQSRVAQFAGHKEITRFKRPPVIRDVMAISRWQSPTANLLHSQSEKLLRSLPQLNQTVREMESFLPNGLN